jgi:hypothetical protein
VVFRLGWRLLRATDRRRFLSMGLVVVGVALAALSVLVGIAAFRTVEARSERVAARAFVSVDRKAPAAAWHERQRMPYGNRMLLRVDVALGEEPPPPAPGLDRWPEPGEVMASPAYQRGLAADPALGSYAGTTIVASVGEAGLRSPDELVVYRGVERADLPFGGVPVVARNDAPGGPLALDVLGLHPKQVAGLTGLFIVLVGLPVAAFLTVAARLTASTRARRLAALRLLGVPPGAVRTVNAVEVAVLAFAGGALGLMLYPFVNVRLAGSGILGFTWFPQDTALTPALVAGVAVAITVFALVIARRPGSTGASMLSTVRTRTAAPASSNWRFVPLAFGMTSLVPQVVAGSTRPEGSVPHMNMAPLVLLSILVTAVGLLVAITPLIRGVGRLARTHAPGLAARLGGARAAFDPAGAGRIVAGLAILVFAIGVAIGQTRDARAVSEPIAATVDVSVSAQDLPAGALTPLLRSSPVPAAVSAYRYGPEGSISGVAVTCDDLERFVVGVTATSTCESGHAYWAVPIPQDPTVIEHLPLVPEVTSDLTHSALPPGLTVDGGTDVVIAVADIAAAIPPSAVESVLDGDIMHINNVQLLFRAPRDSADDVLAHIYGLAPYSQPAAFGLDPDSRENLATINGYIRLGLIGGSVMAFIALITGLADRATERRRADHELLAAGAPAGLIRRAHRWEVVQSTASALVVATVTGAIGGIAWQLGGGLHTTPDWTSLAALAAFVTGGTVAAAVIAARAAPRRLDPVILRRD